MSIYRQQIYIDNLYNIFKLILNLRMKKYGKSKI